MSVAEFVCAVGSVPVLAHHDRRHSRQSARQRCFDRHVDDHPGELHFVKPVNEANKSSGTDRRSDRRPVQGASSGRIATTTTIADAAVDGIAVAVNVGYVGGQQTARFAVDGIAQLRQRIDGK